MLVLLAVSAVLAFVLDAERALTPGGLALALSPLVLLPWRHDAPLPVFLGVELLSFGARATYGPNGPTDLMVLVALFAVASRRGAGPAAAAVTLDVGLLAGATMAASGASAVAVEGLGQLALDVVVVLLGLYLGVRRDHLTQLEDRADRLARLQELESAAAVDTERRRIARELHDVVAHHVSVMTLQAGAVERRLRHVPDTAGLQDAVAELRATGREAMQELRRMLVLLRTDDPGEQRSPQPGLRDLDGLVGRVGEAGLPVRLVTAGELDEPAAGIQAVAYRIVQEALTNTLRHAGAVPTEVTVEVADHQVRVAVHDHPPARPLPRYPGATTSPDAGFGLAGMRERAQLYGGAVEAGPADAGGWRVVAVLPRGGAEGADGRPG